MGEEATTTTTLTTTATVETTSAVTMETLQSSVTILGVETFSPEIDAAVRTTVADALEVDESQVMIISAQSVESGGRRLVGGLHVTFEVIFDSEEEEASADVSEDSQALPSEVAEQTSN